MFTFLDITERKPTTDNEDGEMMPVHYLALLAVGSVLVVAFVVGTVWWIMRKTPGKVKHIRCPSEEEASPKRALIRVADEEQMKTSKT
jgi:hypothetical protein